MITTPFGAIKIYTDDVVVDYEAITHTYNRGPVKDRLLDVSVSMCLLVYIGRFAVKLN